MKRYPSCILATCCTPWDEQNRFAEDVFRRAVRKSLEGTRHLYVFGTAGEGYAVSDEQFDAVAQTFAEEMRAADADPMVGVISLSDIARAESRAQTGKLLHAITDRERHGVH